MYKQKCKTYFEYCFCVNLASVDFLASNVSYSVYPGNTTIKIPVVIVSDNLDEVQETFGVQLSVASGFENKIMLGAINFTTVVISDGNGTFSISISFSQHIIL